MNAVFQLRPLSETNTINAIKYVVPEAIECSKAAMNILQFMYTTTEQRLQKSTFFFFGAHIYMCILKFHLGLNSRNYTTSIPFFRVDDESNDLVFVVDTESLFEPCPHNPISSSSSKCNCFYF